MHVKVQMETTEEIEFPDWILGPDWESLKDVSVWIMAGGEGLENLSILRNMYFFPNKEIMNLNNWSLSGKMQ